MAQADMKTDDVQTLADLAGAVPDGAYLIPFLNVYAALNEDTCFIVDVTAVITKQFPAMRLWKIHRSLILLPKGQ